MLVGLRHRGLGAHAVLARLGQARLGRLQFEHGGRQLSLGCRQLIGGGAPLGGGRLDQVHQFLPPLGDLGRAAAEFLDLGIGGGPPLRQQFQLPFRRRYALAPGAALAFDGRHPRGARLRLPLQAVMGAAAFDQAAAQFGQFGAPRRGPLARRREFRQGGLVGACRHQLGFGFRDIGSHGQRRLIQGGRPRGGRQGALRRGFHRGTRAVDRTQRCLERVAPLALGRRRRAGAAPRFGVAALGLAQGGAQDGQFLLQFVEPRALAQPRFGRRHRAGGDRKSVPSPHRAVARHQALALDEL